MASRATTARLLQRAAVPYKRRGYRIAKYEDGVLSLVRPRRVNPLVALVTLPFAVLFADPTNRNDWIFLTVIGGQVVARRA